MTNEKPKFLKRTYRLTEWFPNSLGYAHFSCVKCDEKVGFGGYWAKPDAKTKVVYTCHGCTRLHYQEKGLRVRYKPKVGYYLEPITSV